MKVLLIIHLFFIIIYLMTQSDTNQGFTITFLFLNSVLNDLLKPQIISKEVSVDVAGRQRAP